MADIDAHLVEADPQSDSLRVLSGQPFDTTKVRLQSAPEGTYNGALDVVKKLLKNEGFAGFYKGTLTPLVGVGACVSIQFSVNEFMKRTFISRNAAAGLENTGLTHGQFYAAGAAAGIANGFLASPIEHIRIRLQTQTGEIKTFNGPIDAVRKMYNGSGVRGVFRGITPTLIREGHGMGAYFLAFEALVDREIKTKRIERKDIPGWKLCLFGASAGYAMWFTSYPIDIVKSKMQTDALDPKNQQYKSMLDCFRKIYIQNGIKGFFKGFLPTILRAAPVNACTFYTFELVIRYLD
ncbi:hypothetical protein D0Z03_002472 [Geotrichum reessii]|nr:hypothetical protein D0Z03_002472 [Galactomyces reessii]